MTDWIDWVIAAGLVVIMELFTGTFYLLMVAVGLLAGAGVALMGFGVPAQYVAAGLVGGAAALGLRKRRAGAPTPVDPARDPNVNLDIGERVKVTAWHGDKARVLYRGAHWDAELAAGSSAQPGEYRIAEVRGSRLVLANQPEE